MTMEFQTLASWLIGFSKVNLTSIPTLTSNVIAKPFGMA
jgi:hypothetical protein